MRWLNSWRWTGSWGIFFLHEHCIKGVKFYFFMMTGSLVREFSYSWDRRLTDCPGFPSRDTRSRSTLSAVTIVRPHAEVFLWKTLSSRREFWFHLEIGHINWKNVRETQLTSVLKLRCRASTLYLLRKKNPTSNVIYRGLYRCMLNKHLEFTLLIFMAYNWSPNTIKKNSIF